MKNHLSMMFIGLTVVLVGYASSAVVVFQAAQTLGATTSQIQSWLWALGLGMGVSTLILSLKYKMPILTAWSTPGAAVLVATSGHVTIEEAVAGFVVCSMLLALVGFLGLMEKLMTVVPAQLSAALLAGVLLSFVLDVFIVAQSHVALVSALLSLYFVGKRYWPRFTIPAVLVVSLIWGSSQGDIQWHLLSWSMAQPEWVTPKFSWQGTISIGIPLFIVTLFSQNLPGLAVLKSHNYQVASSPLIVTTGMTGVLLAPFGGYAFNLAAITAAIAMGDDVHPDRNQRYKAAVWVGVFYSLMGVLAVSVVQFLMSLPNTLIACLAGIALLSTFGNSLAAALKTPSEAAVLTFLITASGISIFGIGSAFWGVLVGVIIHHGPSKLLATVKNANHYSASKSE